MIAAYKKVSDRLKARTGTPSPATKMLADAAKPAHPLCAGSTESRGSVAARLRGDTVGAIRNVDTYPKDVDQELPANAEGLILPLRHERRSSDHFDKTCDTDDHHGLPGIVDDIDGHRRVVAAEELSRVEQVLRSADSFSADLAETGTLGPVVIGGLNAVVNVEEITRHASPFVSAIKEVYATKPALNQGGTDAARRTDRAKYDSPNRRHPAMLPAPAPQMKTTGTKERLAELIDEYFDLGFDEGVEGRHCDTPEGNAQKVRSEIDAIIAALTTEGQP